MAIVVGMETGMEMEMGTEMEMVRTSVIMSVMSVMTLAMVMYHTCGMDESFPPTNSTSTPSIPMR